VVHHEQAPVAIAPMSKLPAMAEKAVAFRTARRAPSTDEPGLYCLLDPLDVARLLSEAGEADPFLMAAAVLHDLLQAAGATEADIATAFGAETAFIAAEVSEHPQLSVSTRKVLRLTLAPHMSRKAKLLKLAQLAVSVCARGEGRGARRGPGFEWQGSLVVPANKSSSLVWQVQTALPCPARSGLACKLCPWIALDLPACLPHSPH
jgi:hypothetical protein